MPETEAQVLTFCVNAMSSCWLWKNSRVSASFIGKLLYAASSQLAISFLEHIQKLERAISFGTHLMVPIRLSTKILYSAAGASSRAFQTFE